MTRIYWICADFNFRFGSAKAEADDDGLSLRLKTVTEHLSCFSFLNAEFLGTQILLIWEIFEIFGFVLEIEIVLEVVLGTRMTRIYWICADFNFRFGSAKAEADDDGFSLRLKTVTEHLSCFRFLNVDFFGTQILKI